MAQQKVISRTAANNLRDLIRVLQDIALYAPPLVPLEEVLVECTVNLVETTLTDGSKVYDINIID